MKNIFFKIKNKQKISKTRKLAKKVIEEIDSVKNLTDEELKDFAYKNSHNTELLIAAISEASIRTLGFSPYEEQIMAAISISINSYLVEMKTGEGKTLTAGISALIKAIRGHYVFVVTVNDYLSKRDLEYNLKLFQFFDISAGSIQSEMNLYERKDIYKSNIIYGTSSEFTFDYLRDNTATSIEMKTIENRKFDSVIVDEIDSVLIDESSVPLIISEENKEQNNETVLFVDKIVKKLNGIDKLKTGEVENNIDKYDFIMDKKARNVLLTEKGINEVEKLANIDNLYKDENTHILHRIEQALFANYMYEKEKDYVVFEDKIILIDQSTGRFSPGRQMSFGLHQAIEAKEGVSITLENTTAAKITYQNFFKKFEYLSGMTGTAKTEEEEFLEIYGLEIIVIPTHKPVIRIDMKDKTFINNKGKENQLLEYLEIAKKTGQPVLIGTTTVEENEHLADLLTKNDFKFNQLNAKNAEKEASIIAEAGNVNTITLATNMAGRGVDIQLSEEAKEKGGLFVIGFGRYRNRRIDNQLRGRSGRQGDPGRSVFILSLTDEVIKNFGGEKLMNVAKNLDISENESIESNMINKMIEKAQKTFENQFFEARKELVKYDDVLSTQRDKIYKIRDNILYIKDREDIFSKVKELISSKVAEVNYIEFEETKKQILEKFNVNVSEENCPKNEKELRDYIEYIVFKDFLEIPPEATVEIIKEIYIDIIDKNWKNHLRELEMYLEGINLLSLGQKDPLIEYNRVGFNMFKETLKKITDDIMYKLSIVSIEIVKSPEIKEETYN